MCDLKIAWLKKRCWCLFFLCPVSHNSVLLCQVTFHWTFRIFQRIGFDCKGFCHLYEGSRVFLQSVCASFFHWSIDLDEIEIHTKLNPVRNETQLLIKTPHNWIMPNKNSPVISLQKGEEYWIQRYHLRAVFIRKKDENVAISTVFPLWFVHSDFLLKSEVHNNNGGSQTESFQANVRLVDNRGCRNTKLVC